jgi:hypothetical protein
MPMTVSGSNGLTFPDNSTQAKSAANGQTGSAPFYSARAWVNFNGTGTVAIRASGNVSSITDNGNGNYTVNFATAFADTNYSFLGWIRKDNNTVDSPLTALALSSDSKSTSAMQIRSLAGTTALFDTSEFNVAIFR